MNRVTSRVKRNETEKMVANDLLGYNFCSSRSAFVGNVGTGKFGLYLVTYMRVVEANDPSNTYQGEFCHISVDRFVDVDISIVEREDK